MPSIAPLRSKHKIPLPGALLEQWNGINLGFNLYCLINNLLYNKCFSFLVILLKHKICTYIKTNIM